MIAAGRRDREIIFLRPIHATDDHGGEREIGTSVLEPAWARVRFGTGAERREAAQVKAVMTATFECLWTPVLATVVDTDRISFEGTWDIRSCALVGNNAEIHFTAARAD